MPVNTDLRDVKNLLIEGFFYIPDALALRYDSHAGKQYMMRHRRRRHGNKFIH